MITLLENYTQDELGKFYDKSDGPEKYELKISGGILNNCEETLTGNHLSNSENCYTCANINKFKSITATLENITDDYDIICGAKKRNTNRKRENLQSDTDTESMSSSSSMGNSSKNNPDFSKKYISPDQFVDSANDGSSYVNNHIYEMAKKMFHVIKNKNISYEQLNDEVLNNIPKGVNLMQTEYYDLYQIILNMYRNNKESSAYNIVKHPLVRLTSDTDNIEIVHNFMKTISMISNSSKVNEFHKKVKYQSLSYEGIEDLENRTIKFSSENSINAILFTFAACKLSYFENVAVNSSSDTLLLQLYNKKKIIRSDNFALAIARYSNIENEVKTTSIVNIADNELRRVNAHLLFKKLVLNIRMGNFDIHDNKELEAYILGLKNTDMTMQFDVSEEENYLRSFFNIFGYNPILVRKNSLINNMYPLKAVPFLPINATQKLGTIDNPIKLASDMNLMINFDALNNKIQITPSYNNTKYASESNMTGILSTLVNPATNAIYYNQMNGLAPTPLLINGTMIYAINRISLDLLNRRGVGELSYIYSKDISLDAIEYDNYMNVNLQKFDLSAIVCYKLEAGIDNSNFKYGTTIGFISFIRTSSDSKKYFCYDDCMNLTKSNRNEYQSRLLRNYFFYNNVRQNNNTVQDVLDVGDNLEDFVAWKEESEAKKLLEDFKNDKFNYYTFIYTEIEVREIAMRTGYLFIYSMEYNEYMKMGERDMFKNPNLI
jgi:hypothetical protein